MSQQADDAGLTATPSARAVPTAKEWSATREPEDSGRGERESSCSDPLKTNVAGEGDGRSTPNDPRPRGFRGVVEEAVFAVPLVLTVAKLCAARALRRCRDVLPVD